MMMPKTAYQAGKNRVINQTSGLTPSAGRSEATMPRRGVSTLTG